MLEFQETLTHEEILLRFKRLFGRDMTPEEKHIFFLPADSEPIKLLTDPSSALRRKLRGNPFGINRPWQCAFIPMGGPQAHGKLISNALFRTLPSIWLLFGATVLLLASVIID